MDPFLDLIHLLRPKATLWAGIEGAGRWGVAFRKRNDILFCWVQAGTCQLSRPHHAPIHLAPNDFVLVRTSNPFTLTSDPSLAPQDSETLVATTGTTRMIVGEGAASLVTLRGGRFVFDTANEHLLTGLLPSLVHIPAGDTASARLRSLLGINETESLTPGPGSEFIITRLMELILVELLRSSSTTDNTQQHSPDHQRPQSGLLPGLADPITSRALTAMHRNPAHPWTLAQLSKLCNVSRSTLSARFRAVVGKGPIDYLLQWRMALAKDKLRQGKQSIGEIALAIGFQSASAFSTAFTRAAGCSPRHFAASAQSETPKASPPRSRPQAALSH